MQVTNEISAEIFNWVLYLFVSWSLQSTSKPFTYAVCRNELGKDVVHQYVGQEPSGLMFNELSLDANGGNKQTSYSFQTSQQ